MSDRLSQSDINPGELLLPCPIGSLNRTRIRAVAPSMSDRLSQSDTNPGGRSFHVRETFSLGHKPEQQLRQIPHNLLNQTHIPSYAPSLPPLYTQLDTHPMHEHQT